MNILWFFGLISERNKEKEEVRAGRRDGEVGGGGINMYTDVSSNEYKQLL